MQDPSGLRLTRLVRLCYPVALLSELAADERQPVQGSLPAYDMQMQKTAGRRTVDGSAVPVSAGWCCVLTDRLSEREGVGAMGIFGKLIGRVANAVDNARYDGKELKTLQKKLEQIEKDLAPKEKDGGKQDTRLMDAMKKRPIAKGGAQ